MSRKLNVSWIGAFIVFAGLLAYLSFPGFHTGDAATLRTPAPGFGLSDLSGKVTRLEDFPQKIKVVNFWATWCHACKIEIPTLQAVHEKYKDRDVAVIGLSVDENPSDVVRFVEASGIAYPMLVNAMETAQTYHLRATPTTIILDENNNGFKKYVGVQGLGTFERDIEALLKSS